MPRKKRRSTVRPPVQLFFKLPPMQNPLSKDSIKRVDRGGSFDIDAGFSYMTNKGRTPANDRYNFLGFRLSKTKEES